MARYLFGVWLAPGHMYPAIAIGHALVQCGHTVAFHTDASFEHLLSPLGIELCAIQGVTALAELRDEPAGAVARKEAFRARFVARVPGDVQSLRQAIAAWRPDVLINDPVMFAPLIAGELCSLPVATINNVIFSWPGEQMAPYGLGLPPAHDAATRLRYAAMRAQGEAFYADVVAGLNTLRAAYGLSPRHGSLAEATLSPYLHLIPTIPALDYDRSDLPLQVHHVGPCLWDPPASAAEAGEGAAPRAAGQQPRRSPEDWLAGLPGDCPLILVAASSVFARSAELVEAALRAWAGCPHQGVCPVTGEIEQNDGPPGVLATLPFDHPLHQSPDLGRACVARYVPHSAVLPRAAAVVTHGGFGMVTKALSYGLPLVVVPYAADQPEVAQRVVAAGAGLRLDPASLTPAALRCAVHSVLHERRYRDRARQLAAAMACYNGPGRSVDLLARLAATGRPVPRDEYQAQGPDQAAEPLLHMTEA